MRFAALLTGLAFGLATPAAAGADPGSDGQALLAELLSGKADTIETANRLAELRPAPVELLEAHLARERKSTPSEHRKVLAAIKADIPDEKGRFRTPKRQTDEQRKAADEYDWLANLAKLSRRPALGDVIADVAAIRALARSENTDAARAILDFSFTEVGLVFRDECGRYLRKMSPHSLPALIRRSQDRSNSSRRRYAVYQLERLDREDPHKALRYTSGDLKVEVLKALTDSQYRTAIYPIIKMLNTSSPKIRQAARDAWLEFATGKPPRKAPKRKLVLPGGKLTDEKEPLYLTHRELADIEIRKLLEQLTGTPPEPSATLAEMTKSLFSHYDDARADALNKHIEQAVESAQSDPAAGAKLADQVLAEVPDHPRRGELASVYFAHGELLEQQESWQAAAIEHAKAQAASPDGETAKRALAQEHYARGKLLESEGLDATEEFARAREAGHESGASAGWMLYAGVGGGIAGLVLVILGFVRRR